MLEALNHPQLPPAIKTDNKTSGQFLNKKLELKRSKSLDKRYFSYWTELLNNNSIYIGTKVLIIMEIISLNIG